MLVTGPQGRRLEFKHHPLGKPLSLPCGRCIGCRLERARQWAVRIMHESKMHDANSFLTMTYDPEHVPKDGSLNVEHVQLFMKRLRSRIDPIRIRFFLCGEYGEKFERPHYHAIVFGFDFPDKVKLTTSGGFTLYESEMLNDVWGMGSVRIGDVTFESASYVANYATKKIIGKGANEHYKGRKPEFLLMSRGGRGGHGGIGKTWIKAYADEVYQSDSIVVRGLEQRPPRFYDNYAKSLGELDSKWQARLQEITAKREDQASKLEEYMLRSGHVVNIAPSSNAVRLAVREKVASAKFALKLRTLESNP